MHLDEVEEGVKPGPVIRDRLNPFRWFECSPNQINVLVLVGFLLQHYYVVQLT